MEILKNKFQKKVVILGDNGVGKREILNRINCQEFGSKKETEEEIEYKKMKFCKIKANVKYNSFASMHYKDTKGIIVVCDVSKKETYENAISEWYKDVNKKIKKIKEIPMILVVNKIDIDEGYAKKMKKNMNDYEKESKRIGFRKLFTVSAKDNIGINEAINYLHSELIK